MKICTLYNVNLNASTANIILCELPINIEILPSTILFSWQCRTNIHTPFLELSSGSEVIPYLQPLPLSGTGFHRFVFSLFAHCDPLNFIHGQFDLVSSPAAEEEEEEEVGGTRGSRGMTRLDHRTFSTSGFISRYPQVEPFSFALFQSQWDDSVQHIYSSVLGRHYSVCVCVCVCVCRLKIHP